MVSCSRCYPACRLKGCQHPCHLDNREYAGEQYKWILAQVTSGSCCKLSKNYAARSWWIRCDKIHNEVYNHILNLSRDGLEWLILSGAQLKHKKEAELQETLSCFPACMLPALCSAIQKQVLPLHVVSRRTMPFHDWPWDCLHRCISSILLEQQTHCVTSKLVSVRRAGACCAGHVGSVKHGGRGRGSGSTGASSWAPS